MSRPPEKETTGTITLACLVYVSAPEPERAGEVTEGLQAAGDAALSAGLGEKFPAVRKMEMVRYQVPPGATRFTVGMACYVDLDLWNREVDPAQRAGEVAHRVISVMTEGMNERPERIGGGRVDAIEVGLLTHAPPRS